MRAEGVGIGPAVGFLLDVGSKGLEDFRSIEMALPPADGKEDDEGDDQQNSRREHQRTHAFNGES
jgi:hypothetical protein